MTDWPTLAINIVTYQRIDTLRETLRRLHTHLWYEGEKRYFVADDGSDDGTQAMLLEEWPDAVLVQSNRSGLGANTNAGLRASLGVADYVLQLQDDMHLLVTLDMHPHIERLRDDPTCGFIRLWGVGGHRYKGNLEGNYWRIHWDSDDLYIPSDRPHVKHRRFHEHFGVYPEGLATGHTEEAWCHQCKNRAGLDGKQLDVFVPQNQLTESTWEHVHWGDRWRDKGL
jgi:glycosyltransferase involved in cell wall biosynthesis